MNKILLDNFSKNIDEKIVYTLFNIIDQDNKYLILNSVIPVNEIRFNR